MKKALVVITILFASLFFSPAPAAQASECRVGVVCGTIKHYSPDTGLDPAILIRCRWMDSRTNHLLREGESSKRYCADTDQVYNRSGQEIWCKYRYEFSNGTQTRWIKKFDATGWHKISDIWRGGEGCVVTAD